MKLFSKEFFQSHQKPYKYDVFIFFQRSQRNCEPEKRSLAGAWRRHLSWPTSLIRKFCQKSIFIWELISCSHRYLKNCCHKYKDNISNCHLFISWFFYRHRHGIMITPVCVSQPFWFFHENHAAIKTRTQGSAEGTLALFTCSKEQCSAFGWFG